MYLFHVLIIKKILIFKSLKLIDICNIPTILVNKSNMIVFANNETYKLLGYSENELLTQNINSVFLKLDYTKIITKSGSSKTTKVEIKKINKNTTLLNIHEYDNTKKKLDDVHRQLQVAIEKKNVAHEAKTIFLANISHEIRDSNEWSLWNVIIIKRKQN